jgi:hypothetical protein
MSNESRGSEAECRSYGYVRLREAAWFGLSQQCGRKYEKEFGGRWEGVRSWKYTIGVET